MNVTESPERLHWLDHLRALAMLAGVLFHAALAYSPLMHPLFPTADRQSSSAVDAVIWGLHLVRMPLFFLVSGYFAALLIERRGGIGLVRQRLRRVALPFLVAWPLVLWSTSRATVWAAENVQHPSPMLAMIKQWLAMPDAPSLPPGTAHLWFLFYLLIFGVLHWVLRTLDAGRVGRWLMRQRPAWLLLALPLLLVPALASVSAPHPAPEGLLPQFWAIVFYGAFFAFGACLHGQDDWLARVRPLWPALLVACGAFYALFLWRLAETPPSLENLTAPLPLAVLEACLSVWLTVVCLLAGQRLLSRPSAVLRYLSQSAYWTYLWHLPLLFVVQYALMDLSWPWPVKFAVASGATLAVCLISYQILVRHTPLRRFVG